MNELLKIFDKSPHVTAGLNLLACCIAAAWTRYLAGAPRPAFRLARRGWIMFWIATGAFYLFQTILPGHSFPRIGLYVATGALLAAWDRKREHDRWPAISWLTWCVLAVVSCVTVDAIVAHYKVEDVGAHQLLTAIAIGLWAWRAREVDVQASMVIAGYAIVQLPVHQLLTIAGVDTNVKYDDFVASTYLVYAGLKLVLVPPLCTMLAEKPSPPPTPA